MGEMVMNKYDKYLQKHFDKRFKQYEDSIEWYVNPKENQWRFYIPELNVEISMACVFFYGKPHVYHITKRREGNGASV